MNIQYLENLFNKEVEDANAALTAVNASLTAAHASVAALQTDSPTTKLVYKALVTQSASAAPTASVNLNTLGITPLYSWSASGTYKLTASVAKFTSGKTIATINNINGASHVARIARASTTVINIFSGKSTATLADAKLTKVPIQIEVYT